MYNPDYPTNTGSFLQHTYRQPEMVNETFYYAGGGTVTQNPFNPMTDSDSRRNIGMYGGYNPQMSYQQPAVQNTNNQQTQVMPFSSYPSGVPNNGTPAFNAMAESRRNTAVAVNNNGNVNPWSNVQQPTAPTAPTVFPQQNANMYSNPYANPYAYNNPCCDYQTAALYGGSFNSFDKKNGCWDNMYTEPRPIPQPYIDWNHAMNAQHVQSYQPQYPQVSQYPQTNLNWVDIAKQNWGGY